MKPAIFALAAALLSMGASSLWAADKGSSSDLSFKGRPITYWLEVLQPGRSASAEPKMAEAEEAIHAIGPDALPSILDYRKGSRSERLEVIRHACLILSPEVDLKLADTLRDGDSNLRETVLEVLPESATAMAMGDILKASNDAVRPVRSAALRALVRLAPGQAETIAALIEILGDAAPSPGPGENSFSRDDAALALGALGAKAKAAIPELSKLLDDPDDFSRETAATALWKIDRSPSAIPVLVERLDTATDYQTCLRVMKILAQIGPQAKSAVPVLKKRIEEPGLSFVPPDVDIARTALGVLTRIDPSAAGEARKSLEGSGVEKR